MAHSFIIDHKVPAISQYIGPLSQKIGNGPMCKQLIGTSFSNGRVSHYGDRRQTSNHRRIETAIVYSTFTLRRISVFLK